MFHCHVWMSMASQWNWASKFQLAVLQLAKVYVQISGIYPKISQAVVMYLAKVTLKCVCQSFLAPLRSTGSIRSSHPRQSSHPVKSSEEEKWWTTPLFSTCLFALGVVSFLGRNPQTVKIPATTSNMSNQKNKWWRKVPSHFGEVPHAHRNRPRWRWDPDGTPVDCPMAIVKGRPKPTACNWGRMWRLATGNTLFISLDGLNPWKWRLSPPKASPASPFALQFWKISQQNAAQ